MANVQMLDSYVLHTREGMGGIDPSQPWGTTSPGGTPARYSYTGGMYGQGASRSDVYGSDNDRYPIGEYGNMYDKGPRGAYVHEGYQPGAPSPQPNDLGVTMLDAEPKRRTVWLHVSIAIVAVIAFITIAYCSQLFEATVIRRYFGKKELSIKSLTIVTVILVAILFVCIYLLDIPLARALCA